MSSPAGGLPTRLPSPQFRQRPAARRPSKASEPAPTVVDGDEGPDKPLGFDDAADFGFGLEFEPGPAGAGQALAAAVETQDKKVIDSTFGRMREALRAETTEPGERANLIVLQALQDMVLDLIPIAESKYRENGAERAAYALNVYINQAREIQNDMRSVHDFSQVAFKIMEVIAHFFTLIAQNLMTEHSRLSQVIGMQASSESRTAIQGAAHDLVQVQGQFLNETLKSLRDHVMAQFVTPPAGPGAKKGAGSAGTARR